uniref:NADH-ubiquinone oxidoreductase chain 3 n=1 Tax=Drilaster sp. BMNH 840462 TaxID=904163 RepID=E3VTA2_9COLE|nr:NADH dehydrogenase subunit 3 [Drilaster sp. BMNH 840462]
MMLTAILSFLTLTITFLLMMLANIISMKTMVDREKSSPFECGFDPKSSPRMSFSLHFFLIAVIFLIFDVEITLLMPFILTLKTTNTLSFSIMMSLFITILLIGLYHEWKQGALKWTN